MKRTLTLLLFLCAALAGCSDDPVSPGRRSTGPMEVRSIPLDVGARWTYAHTFMAEWLHSDGTHAREPVMIEATGSREIIGTEMLDGREYALEAQRVNNDGEIAERWMRIRQDGSALYRADVSLSIPPGEVVVDSAGFGDQTRLLYPLTIDDTWELRPGNTSVTMTMESLDTLSTPAGEMIAYRVRIDTSTQGEDDHSHVWYNAAGMVRRETHREIDAVDGSSGLLIHIVTNDLEELSGVELP